MTKRNDSLGVVDRAGDAAADRAADSTYWTIGDIQYHCRIGRSTAWRLVRRPGFPSPVVFSARAVMWPRAEVIEYMELRRDPDHYRDKSGDRENGQREEAFTSRPLRRRR